MNQVEMHLISRTHVLNKENYENSSFLSFSFMKHCLDIRYDFVGYICKKRRV